ncbi:MAG: aminopeptidase P N-terminal domain-containing protein [Thiomicrorhabdus sp.]|nr:aminopeptidase P N-terminal domain-containing protein [Thiomicrorhabdus sp.]
MLNTILEQPEFYQKNRQTLLEQLPDNSVVFVSSGAEKIRNRDVEFPFRAQSDFIYLTGFEEPDSVLVLLKTKTVKSHLFVREKDPEQETWQGRRLGVEAVPNTLNLDYAYDIESLDDEILGLLDNVASVYVSFSQSLDFLGTVHSWIYALKEQGRKGVEAPKQVCDLDTYLHEMRVIKSETEIKRLRKAATISVQGHLAAMKSMQSSVFEFQVQADLEAAFLRLGSPRVAFNSIVASGENACILHYTENRSEIKKGDLVLVDAGAEWQGYAGDITTTFPASGHFSTEQAQLYSLVLNAQQAAIDVIKPKARYDMVHQASIKVLAQGLLDLGLLQGDLDAVLKDEAYKRFFMHGTGHWLGMDVHDVGAYKQNGEWRAFKPGMVVTVEPGLYISDVHQDVDKKWHNIGIRIEDDILVTSTGREVLTKGLPRTVEEIETWMRQDKEQATIEVS